MDFIEFAKKEVMLPTLYYSIYMNDALGYSHFIRLSFPLMEIREMETKCTLETITNLSHPG